MKKWWWNGNLKLLYPMFAQLWVQQVRPDEKAYYIIPADRWEKLRKLVEQKLGPLSDGASHQILQAIEAIEGEA